jgi:type II secretion system protein J
VKLRGFTLLEAVVALAVLALMAGALLGLVSRLQGEARGLEQAADQTAEYRSLFRLMDRDLRAAVLHPASGAPLQGSAVHYGDHDLDAFTLLRGVDPEVTGGYPQERVSYQASRQTDDTVSVVRADDAAQGGATAANVPLVTGLKAFRVRYLGSDGQWVSLWPKGGATAQGMPRALRVELEDGSGVIWHTTFSLPASRNG